MLDTSGHPRSQSASRRLPDAEHGERSGEPDPWDLVTVPARQGLEAVDILRLRTGVGPVLHDGPGGSLGFVVPPGTAESWDHPGSSCTRADGRGLVPGAEPPMAGADWLVSPQAASGVTDPVVLRAALGEAARTIKAADGL